MSLIPRRRVIRDLAALGGVGLLPATLRAADAVIAANSSLPEYPFKLGVASGFPTDASVVLWTRLAPTPAQPDGGLPPLDFQVGYEIATDERFRRIAARGEVIAPAQFAHSVHLEARGLASDREYWYRFMVGGHVSAVGRTRTLPFSGVDVRELHLLLACCQHYEHGHYAALRHMAAEAPQLIVHVGDYIYEGAPTRDRVRAHTGGLCRTLDDYRLRYALYQGDAALQAAHAAAPWLITWDDHEVANDYSGIHSGRNEEPAVFLARRAAAYQAWYEHLPVPPAMAPGVDPDGMHIFARRQVGRLATLHLLDQRQYRSAQACPQPNRAGGNRVGDDCAERVESARTMLGAEQELWLARGLRQYPAQWTLLGQGTLFSQLDELPGEANQYWTDGWTGYPAARQRLIDALRATRTANPVILSGDLHAFVAAEVHATPENPDTPLVATELLATSISSDGRPQASLDVWRDNNPHIKLLDSRQRGYVSLRLSAGQLHADLVVVDDVNRADSGRHVMRSFVVEAGSPRLMPA